MLFGKETSKNILNNYCLLSIVLNILTICFSVAYYIVPVQSILLDFFGIVLILSWLVNILIIYLDDKYLIKSSEIGSTLNRLTYFYIFFFIIGIFLILLSIVISNFLLIGEFSLILTYFMVFDLFIGLIGIAVFGIYLAIKNLSNIEKRGVFSFEKR